MFVLISDYLKPVDQVDALYAEHAAWLQTLYDSGRVLGSGRRNPSIGGLILARGKSREEIEEVWNHDPFVQHGCAHYTIYEFTPNPPPRRSQNLDAWLTSAMSG